MTVESSGSGLYLKNALHIFTSGDTHILVPKLLLKTSYVTPQIFLENEFLEVEFLCQNHFVQIASFLRKVVPIDLLIINVGK